MPCIMSIYMNSKTVSTIILTSGRDACFTVSENETLVHFISIMKQSVKETNSLCPLAFSNKGHMDSGISTEHWRIMLLPSFEESISTTVEQIKILTQDPRFISTKIMLKLVHGRFEKPAPSAMLVQPWWPILYQAVSKIPSIHISM